MVRAPRFLHLLPLLALVAALLLPRAAPAQEALPDLGPPREVLRYTVAYDGGPKGWSYEARLFSDHKAYYYGRGLVKSRGRRSVTLSEQQYDSLLRALEYANFRRMRAPESRGNVKWAITYSDDGVTRTLRGADAGPDWPKSLIQLIWSLESVLQTKDFACPIYLTINKEDQEACDKRNALMEKYYPRR